MEEKTENRILEDRIERTDETYSKKITQGLLQFIQDSPSMFHVIDNIKKRLNEAGFEERREQEPWEIRPGGAYYVTRNDSSLIAFRLPAGCSTWEELPFQGYHIVAAHSDSPSFKIKALPEVISEKQYVRLNVEMYGGMILSTWLDRPLSVAGRVAVRQEDGSVSMRLVNLDKDLLVIPNLAIHMNREINKGYEYNPQVDMLPLMGLWDNDLILGNKRTNGHPNRDAEQSRYNELEKGAPAQSHMPEHGAGMLAREIAKALDIRPEDILDGDLYLYVRERGRVLGANGEFILSPKLDDLQCVYAGLESFTVSVPAQYANVFAVFDNEEVGSATRQGADSTFLEDVLVRIQDSLGYGPSVYRRLVAESFMISADNAHAVHPAHPEKADPTNRPLLGGGIVIKYHGGQKYTSDALSAARMKEWCRQAKAPCQTFANRSDAPGGSTLGNISAAHVSLPCVDIGLPQLAMHSAVETGSSRDTAFAVAAFEQFWQE